MHIRAMGWGGRGYDFFFFFELKKSITPSRNYHKTTPVMPGLQHNFALCREQH